MQYSRIEKIHHNDQLAAPMKKLADWLLGLKQTLKLDVVATEQETGSEVSAVIFAPLSSWPSDRNALTILIHLIEATQSITLSSRL